MLLVLAFLSGQDFSVLDSGHHPAKTVKDPARYFWIADAESLKASWKQEQARGEAPTSISRNGSSWVSFLASRRIGTN